MQKTSAKLPKKQTTEEKLAVFGLIQEGHAVELDDIDERIKELQTQNVPAALFRARVEVIENYLAKEPRELEVMSKAFLRRVGALEEAADRANNPYVALAAEKSRLRIQTVEVSYAYLLERVAYLELPWWRRLFAPLPLVQEEASE